MEGIKCTFPTFRGDTMKQDAKASFKKFLKSVPKTTNADISVKVQTTDVSKATWPQALMPKDDGRS